MLSKFIDEWEEGKEPEINFWRDWFVRKGFQYQEDRRLNNLFDFMIGNKKEVKIANLGAGAINLIGNKRRDVKVKVIASDLLADDYMRIRKELHITTPVPIERQDMADLTYGNDTFDIVYCANALDHCLDPRKAIEEMLRVCKFGGWIYLWHHAHEGKRLGYHGLHKWNLDITDEGDCRFWNREEKDTFLLSDIYPGFTTNIRKMRRADILTSFVQKKYD